MPYRRKDNTFRKVIGFLLVAAIAGAAVLVLGRRTEEERQVPIYGTSTDTGYVVVDEEVGVFEDPAADDVVTMPPVEETPPARPVARPQPAVAEAPSPATRTRAEASIPRYETALAAKKKDPLLLNNYAWSLHLAGRYAEAERVLRQVIQIAPNRAIAYANLGESLWKQGKNQEAAAMYRKFLQLNSDPRRERIAEGKVAAITGR